MNRDEGNRYAAHRVLLPTGEVRRQHVVHTDGHGRVCEVYPLEGEPARVEWLPGAIELYIDEQGDLRARHCQPYDLIGLQPVAETRRRPLP